MVSPAGDAVPMRLHRFIAIYLLTVIDLPDLILSTLYCSEHTLSDTTSKIWKGERFPKSLEVQTTYWNSDMQQYYLTCSSSSVSGIFEWTKLILKPQFEWPSFVLWLFRQSINSNPKFGALILHLLHSFSKSYKSSSQLVDLALPLYSLLLRRNKYILAGELAKVPLIVNLSCVCIWFSKLNESAFYNRFFKEQAILLSKEHIPSRSIPMKIINNRSALLPNSLKPNISISIDILNRQIPPPQCILSVKQQQHSQTQHCPSPLLGQQFSPNESSCRSS